MPLKVRWLSSGQKTPGAAYSSTSVTTLLRIRIRVSGAAFRFRKLPPRPRGAEYIGLSSSGVYPPRHGPSTAGEGFPHLLGDAPAISVAGRFAGRIGGQDAKQVVRLRRAHDRGVVQRGEKGPRFVPDLGMRPRGDAGGNPLAHRLILQQPPQRPADRRADQLPAI